jgi:hypothetical protein
LAGSVGEGVGVVVATMIIGVTVNGVDEGGSGVYVGYGV